MSIDERLSATFHDLDAAAGLALSFLAAKAPLDWTAAERSRLLAMADGPLNRWTDAFSQWVRRPLHPAEPVIVWYDLHFYGMARETRADGVLGDLLVIGEHLIFVPEVRQ